MMTLHPRDVLTLKEAAGIAGMSVLGFKAQVAARQGQIIHRFGNTGKPPALFVLRHELEEYMNNGGGKRAA
jgi:hypothetical protein